ncbi:hypothetical protein [Mucilaginibacter sp.]|uniref:hypothetical protein n=1 Tax=Mucilaginibacter sp. TaxID=1882438 RepID=UPI0026154AE2|nr:hypothetical protein [Mucilaginibacter sp.]MDB4920140.1 hypothetical protein [Mucilaginibacter sp.]
MKNFLFVFFILMIFIKANAQSPADSATIKKSTLKTLTDEEYTALLNGSDLYHMSLAAELNHFPSPEKALKYKKELDLSPQQLTKFTAIVKELHRKILEMGLIIIRNERTLDSIFKYNRLDNGTLIFYANRYGLYQGELRNVILQSCLVTKNLLTPQQVRKIESLEKRN